jgi:hypothetical protein
LNEIDLGLSVFGAMSGAVGAASGYYSHVLSGYRVSARIGIAIGVPGSIIKIDEKWKGSFGTGINYIHDSEQIFVEAWNRGRMPINVNSINLFTRPLMDGKTGRVGMPKFDSPSGFSSMPHRLEFGSSSLWLYPFHDAMGLSRAAEVIKPKKRGNIQAELMMGDAKIRLTKNWLSHEWLDSFAEKWATYQKENPPGFRFNI